jgi:ABC-type branched-subunit amino acid transport system substrate-binding protein
MGRRGLAALGVACAMALVLTACGSDDEEDGGRSSGSAAERGGGTRTVGILTNLSGPNANAAQGSIRGAEARFASYDGECSDLEFEIVEADDGSSTAGALTGAQKLIQQDEVFAMLTITPYFAGASTFVTTQGSTTPVIGGAWDGAQEWNDTDDNMFASGFVPDYEADFTTPADFMELQGATNVAGIAHVSPSSQAGLQTAIDAFEAAGIEVGYTNNSVQIGSLDVGALVIGILESDADAVYAAINFDTSLALVAGLKQANWQGTFLSLTGYGADLLGSEPAVQIGQGVIFSNSYTPVDEDTPATQELRSALQDHAGNESGIPGFYESQGWFGASLLLHGLEKAGCDASQEDLIATLQETDDWDANGMYPTPIPQSTVEYDEQCSFHLILQGDAFVPVEGANPLCGTPLN